MAFSRLLGFNRHRTDIVKLVTAPSLDSVSPPCLYALMPGQHRVDKCAGCHEDREIVGRDLCLRCYSRQRRTAFPWTAADKHNKQVLKAQRKLRSVCGALLNAAEDGIDILADEDVAAIRAIVQPYMAGLAGGLAPEKVGSGVGATTPPGVGDNTVEAEEEPEPQPVSPGKVLAFSDNTRKLALVTRPEDEIVAVGDLSVVYLAHAVPDSDEWWEELAALPWVCVKTNPKRKDVSYGLAYHYGPTAKPPLPWPEDARHPVMRLKAQFEALVGQEAVQAKLNYFADGTAIIRAHCDDGHPTFVGGFSFGAERVMRFEEGGEVIDVPLAPGSLIYFNAEVNDLFTHEIIPSDTVEPRISVTFRCGLQPRKKRAPRTKDVVH